MDLGASVGLEGTAIFMSSDGEVLAGHSRPNSVQVPAAWSATGGAIPLQIPQGQTGTATGVSDDGSVICGVLASVPFSTFQSSLYLWDSTTGAATPTPADASVNSFLSADGTVLGGTLQPSEFSPRRAFRWTATTGLVELDGLGFRTTIDDMSSDGSVFVGSTDIGSSGSAFRAVRWVEGAGFELLSGLETIESGALAVSDDGQTIAGVYRPNGPSPLETFVWSEPLGLQHVPMLQMGDPGDFTLSADGSALVFAQRLSGVPTAYVWRASAGTRLLSQQSFRPSACSADGTIIVGNASQSFFDDTPLLWTEAGGIELLPHLDGTRSTVRCMSDDGLALGGASRRGPLSRPAGWRITRGLGTTVCTQSVPNSVGAFASMAIQGNNLLEFQPMRLQASELPVSSFGYFLVSNQQGSSMPPGSLGTLCLAGEIGRYSGPGQVLMANAQGGVELTIDPGTLPGPTGIRTPTFGEPWTFQLWYRDSINGAPTSHLTSAVQIRFY